MLFPHTSHLLHPLDRICFSTLERSYKQAYQRFLRQNPIHVICKFNIAAITGKAYQVGLNPCNLQGNFRRTGIFQFDPTVITLAQTHPFLIYQNTEGQKLPELREGGDNFRPALNSAVLEANQSTTQQRNTYKIVGGHTITEDDLYEKIQDHRRTNSCKGEVPKSKPKVKKGTTQNNSKTMAAKKPKSMGQGLKSKKFNPPLKDSSVPQILQINQLPESVPEVIDSQEPGTSGYTPVHTTGNSEDSDDFEDVGENCCLWALPTTSVDDFPDCVQLGSMWHQLWALGAPKIVFPSTKYIITWRFLLSTLYWRMSAKFKFHDEPEKW